jgi:outer membrane protein OmpA-like peptidoglycan-associated protein
LPTQKDAQSSAASAAPVSSGALNEAGAVASVAPMTSPEASRAASPPAVATTTPPKVTTQTATAVSPEPPPAPSSQPSSGARHQATATATLSAPKEDAAPSACREASHQIAALAPLRFARGSTALGRRNRSTLDQLVKAAASCPTITLRVSGHADASGQSRHNAKLAERRAGAAVGYLIARGIDGGRLTAVGYGDSRPVAPNDNESDRAKNRRIEFEVSGNPEGTAKEQGTGNGLPDH